MGTFFFVTLIRSNPKLLQRNDKCEPII